MGIELISPQNLRWVWPAVKAGLEKMPESDWIPEDVYHLIKSGDSALYVGHDEGAIIGFMVLRQLAEEFSGKSRLHVWLAYNTSGQDIRDAAESLILQVAKNMQATRITFGSPRVGWAKQFPVIDSTYEIPVRA